MKKSEVFKPVRILEIDGKIDQIDLTKTTESIMQNLIECGDAIDIGTKWVFTRPPCLKCGQKTFLARIVDEQEKLVETRIFCRCGHLEKME